MPWTQHHLQFSPRRRGFHLITGEIARQIPEMEQTRVGLLHLLVAAHFGQPHHQRECRSGRSGRLGGFAQRDCSRVVSLRAYLRGARRHACSRQEFAARGYAYHPDFRGADGSWNLARDLPGRTPKSRHFASDGRHPVGRVGKIRRLDQLADRSSFAMTARAISSAHGRATTCTPIGSPALPTIVWFARRLTKSTWYALG